MDRRLLKHYNRELQHVRESAADFAREFPKVAGRLGIEGTECADPYVERLIEGFAFLTARVQLKLEAEFPRLTQGLLETVYPQYLAPTPSMAVVRFEPDLADSGLAEGFRLPRGRPLRSMIGKGEQTACEYRTAHDVTLLPLEVVAVDYFTRGLAALHVPESVRGAKAAIRIRLRATAGLKISELRLDELDFYLHGAGEVPMALYELILAHGIGVLAQPTTDPPSWQQALDASSVRRVGYDDHEALLPYGARSFQGYRLLHEYFVLPQRFLFLRLANLARAVSRCDAGEIDLIILLDEADLDLEDAFDASSFRLFCTPAANLFPKRADRIHLSERFTEFHVVPDRTRPLDFEVYEVRSVTGYGESADDQQVFRPFYSTTDREADDHSRGAYFSVNRVPRALSAKEAQRGRRSSYAGSEVYVSLVDANAAPYRTDLRQLGVETLCTNRDLALRMPVGRGQTDFTMEEGAPIKAVRCLSGPTPPSASHAEGQTAWRVISHLTLNYMSLVDADEREGAAALRDLLKLYANQSEAHIRKQVEGVKHIRPRPITRRVPTPGPIAFARGLELNVHMDESAFEGTGVFILGSVLEAFFSKYVSINSFTETVLHSDQRGEIMRWPPRMGLRQIV